jgi:hypothetical protein
MKPFKLLPIALSIALLAQTAWAQNLFVQGNALSNRTFNSDNGPTNSQLTLDFANAQPGILQNILTWGETSGSSLSGIGQIFEVFVLRPLNSTNYQVVFATGYFTVTNVGTNTFAVSGSPFGLQVGDVVAHYGRGIPFSNGTGGPSSVYIAANLPPPVVGNTITVPSSTYPLYSDGGRNYAIQVQLLGQPFLVTTNHDNGPGSLRQAVLNANAFVNASTINFATNLSGQTILLTNGQIALSNNVTIDASALASGIQINGNAQSRIFGITNRGVTVTLNSLTLTNAANVGAPGPDYGSAADGDGGAIYNAGNLIVNNCTLAGNSAQGGDGENAFECVGGRGVGGGIYNDGGTLTVNNSTLAGNTANGGNGGVYVNGGDGLGGGILNTGTLTLNNSTLANNSDTGGNSGQDVNGADGQGGGIYNAGTLIMNSCTLANNSSTGGQGGTFAGNGSGQGGGVYSTSTLSLTNTIVCSNAASSNPNIFGTFSTANDLVNTNALLAPLGNYGGPTQTIPPEPGSPAIGAGNVTAASQFATDQRGPGCARVVSGMVDIGAVEIQSGQSYSIVESTLDSGPGSLRQVISNAPASATVTFATSMSGQTITLTSGQIVLSNTVYIYGTGLSNGVQINGHGTSRIFQVNSGTTAILDGLTLTNGNPGANPGGAIYNSSGTLLELAACTLAGNSSSQGGAIENQGTCALFECTLTGNYASGNGGAIDNNQGPLQLIQCTVVSNTASGAAGGVANYLNTLAMTNCIVAGNSSVVSGGDIYNFGSSTVNAGGTNLVQSYANAGTFNGIGSLVSKAPLLASLGNYGGLTPTMPPLRGSSAIDGGNAAAEAAEGFTVDQRGYPRVSGARVDIGAVEVQIAAAPFPITELPSLENGSFQFGLTNLVGGSFTVFASTNVALPFHTWSDLGPVPETPVGSGVFQFTDTQATNFSRRFYRVSSP